MRTQNSRLLLTIPPEAREVLKGLSMASGQPMASIVTELLVGALPSLRKVTAACLAVRKQQVPEAMNAMRGMMQDAGFVLDEAQNDLDNLEGDIDAGKT